MTVIAEPRWSPYKSLQAEGRSQRNGTEAPVWYPFAEGTIEDRVIRTAIEGMRSTAMVNGDSTEQFAEMSALLGGKPEYAETVIAATNADDPG